MNRRAFLRQSGLLGGGAVAGLLADGGALPAISAGAARGESAVSSESGVSIIRDPADPVVSGRPVQWAIREVGEALAAHGVPVRLFDRLQPGVVEATPSDARQGAGPIVIPGDYTDSPFPVQYYFELRDPHNQSWLHPGFTADLCSQPYFVVRQVRQSVTIATAPAAPVRALQP
jgi:hypothetical protein